MEIGFPTSEQAGSCYLWPARIINHRTAHCWSSEWTDSTRGSFILPSLNLCSVIYQWTFLCWFWSHLMNKGNGQGEAFHCRPPWCVHAILEPDQRNPEAESICNPDNLLPDSSWHIETDRYWALSSSNPVRGASAKQGPYSSLWCYIQLDLDAWQGSCQLQWRRCSSARQSLVWYFFMLFLSIAEWTV